MIDQADARTFEAMRAKLLGLAYRMLGSRADAEDIVQDTFVAWAGADRAEVANAGAWLMTTCAHRCLDVLRSSHRARTDYVGTWLPEPIHTAIESAAERNLDQAASLQTAFLLVLDRLTPRERAAYLLREIFELSYSEVADALAISETACRKLVSRAKVHVDVAQVRSITTLEQQEQLLAAFQDAVKTGATSELATLLSRNIRLAADGGGKVPAVEGVLRGRAEVLGFIATKLRTYWQALHLRQLALGGGAGLLVTTDDAPHASVSFAFDEAGAATDVFIMRNPEKLVDLSPLEIV